MKQTCDRPILPEEEISIWISAVNRICPFFSALAMFAECIITERIPTAATDGKRLFFNPAFMGSLPQRARLGVLVHELLHAALMHPSRTQHRSPIVWNIAADIVVNGIVLAQEGLALPEGAIQDQQLAHLSVEEVYELLFKKHPDKDCSQLLAESGIGWDLSAGGIPGQSTDPDEASRTDLAKIEGYWKGALLEAESVARLGSGSRGSVPAEMARAFDRITCPTLDWKTMLWRHLVRTPVDFSGFDRRFIGDGLYLENLEGDSLKVTICIDTSASINRVQLSSFLAEVVSILRAYPHITASLYFADAGLHGPVELDASSDPHADLIPIGGGGTCFCPFFTQLEESKDESGVAVYLTDGYGTFPESEPALPCLWVVPPGGLESDRFPFGEVSRMIIA